MPLAVAIGHPRILRATVHLDFDVLEQISFGRPGPLVLHGASGLMNRAEASSAGRDGEGELNAELRRSYLDAITKGLDHGGDDIVRLQLAAVPGGSRSRSGQDDVDRRETTKELSAYDSMKVVITGANGFLGNLLTAALVARESLTVRLV